MTVAVSAGNRSLQNSFEANGVRYAFASYVDLHGVSKGKMVPIAHLDRMMQGSELFTDAALDAVPQAVSDYEVAVLRDPQSVIVLPRKKEVAWFASDLHLHGKPFEACAHHLEAPAPRYRTPRLSLQSRPGNGVLHSQGRRARQPGTYRGARHSRQAVL